MFELLRRAGLRAVDAAAGAGASRLRKAGYTVAIYALAALYLATLVLPNGVVLAVDAGIRAGRRARGRARGPRVITLCGSTRFRDAFEAETRFMTLTGAIVLAPGVYGHAEDAGAGTYGTDDDPSPAKVALDELHRHKIAMSDEVRVICPGGYVGTSTRGEIAYAGSLGIPVTYAGYGPGVDLAYVDHLSTTPAGRP